MPVSSPKKLLQLILGETARSEAPSAEGPAEGPAMDPLLKKWIPHQRHDLSDWDSDADWTLHEQQPMRARRLLWAALLMVVVLVVWASLAEVDEVTRGEGRVIPTSQLQIVQAVDGGVVEELKVREGQIVKAGSVLLRIDPTRFISNLRENRAQYLSLTVQAARLEALSRGQPFAPSAEVLEAVPEIVAHEQRLYDSSLAEVNAQISIAKQRRDQRTQEMLEARSRRDQAKRGLALAEQELSVTKPLLGSGAVSEVEVLRLERDVSRMSGERDQAVSQILRLQSAIAEAERTIQEVELNFRKLLQNELSDTLAKLESLGESRSALADRVAKAEVRAPMHGTVKRVLVNTVGAVVQPGQALVEIVPLDEALVLETRFLPRDIAFLRPDLPAVVKFTAYDFAIYGSLDAVVELISADSVIDDQGNAYFLARVRTLESDLGEGLPIIPGMVAQVDVLTGKKTILAYLLKPVLRAKANALSER